MAEDRDGNYIPDVTLNPYENMDPYPTDNSGNALSGVAQSPVTTNADGSISVTNQDGTVSNYPKGSTVDSSGNILNSLGKIIGTAGAGLVAGALTPYLNNLFSNGYLKKSADLLSNAGQNVSDVSTPNLLNLIPTLQQQQMVGSVQGATVTPGQSTAATTTMQGTMSPATYSALLASMQGTMSPASYSAVNAVMQGTMTPAQASAVLQQDSLMKGVNTDQQSINAQRQALQRLADLGQNGGMSQADRSQLAENIAQTNAAAASQRAAQIQQLQSQGNAGTGAELAARLSGGQQVANANAMAGANVATAAQARALQALQANLQGNSALNSQLFNQEAQKAQAQDIVNQFNTNAQNTMNLQNAKMAQDASLANFTTANQIALQNAQAQNTAGQTNAQLAQQAGLANFNTANQIALANQQAQNTAGQYNATNQQNANQSNFNMANQIALQNAANQQQSNITNSQLATQAGINSANNEQQARLANFNTANTIAGTNVGIANQNLLMPYQATQQNYTNQIGKQAAAGQLNVNAGKSLADLVNAQLGRSNSAAGVANTPTSSNSSGGGGSSGLNLGSIASTVGSLFGGSGSSGSNLLSGIGDLFSDKNLKTDKKELSDDEVDEMMAKMTGYKYRYKGPKSNPQITGVMAQDMPKSSVIDTPNGKMIQKPEALSQALAVLANQHQRIKRLEGAK